MIIIVSQNLDMLIDCAYRFDRALIVEYLSSFSSPSDEDTEDNSISDNEILSILNKILYFWLTMKCVKIKQSIAEFVHSFRFQIVYKLIRDGSLTTLTLLTPLSLLTSLFTPPL